MDRDNAQALVNEAIAEAERFIKRAKALRITTTKYSWGEAKELHGAAPIKRAALDLGAALAAINRR